MTDALEYSALRSLLRGAGVVALSSDSDGFHVTAVRGQLDLPSAERVQITAEGLTEALELAQKGVATWTQ